MANMRSDIPDLCGELDVAVVVLDAKSGVFLYVNQSFCDAMEMSEAQILKSDYSQVFWSEFHQTYESLVEATADGQGHTDVYYWVGRNMWAQVFARRIEWQLGQIAVLLTTTNITEVASSLYEYKQMAFFDPELNLPNNHSLEQDISSLDALGNVGAVRFDLCRISNINDLYGRKVMSLLLRQVRDWALETCASTARLYRVNENGFCILRHETNLSELEKRVEQIVQRFRQPWHILTDGKPIQVYCDINTGIIFENNIASELKDLLFHSMGCNLLQHCLEDKKCYTLYDKKYIIDSKKRLRLGQNLTNCIHSGMTGFSVCYQPIVESKTGRWIGVEALCRWELSDEGMVPPSAFIEEAEQSGLINTLDDWVHKTAISHCQNLGLGRREFRLNVNLSPTRKVDTPFINKLFQLVEEIGYPPNKLSLELTETAKMRFDDETLANLKILKTNNIGLALDDFGSGYSSFENLLRLSAHTLKADRSIIENIETDVTRQHLMQMLVRLADFADMRLVVEGVETVEQKELLQSYGVGYMQGYLFSRPLTADQLQQHKDNFRVES